jgi:hypothetical protein
MGERPVAANPSEHRSGIGVLGLMPGLALGVARGSGITPTDQWVDLYSDHSSFAGVPIPAGSYVAAFDLQGLQCGEFNDRDKKLPAGWYGLMPCYSTGVDNQGPVAGE